MNTLKLIALIALAFVFAVMPAGLAKASDLRVGDRVIVNERWYCFSRPLPRPFAGRVTALRDVEAFDIREVWAARAEGRAPVPHVTQKARVRPDACPRTRVDAWARNLTRR